jgi:DNA-binding transcriptional ArsR family regulator
MHDPISNTFSALADPTRRAILARLAMGETSVTELAEPFEMSMPAVSKHLRVLEKAGLVERSRQAQFRPVKLRPEPLKQAWGWIEQYRQFWEESFDRLDAYLKRLQAEEAKGAKAKKTTRRSNKNGKETRDVSKLN